MVDSSALRKLLDVALSEAMVAVQDGPYASDLNRAYLDALEMIQQRIVVVATRPAVMTAEGETNGLAVVATYLEMIASRTIEVLKEATAVVKASVPASPKGSKPDGKAVADIQVRVRN